MSEQSRNDQAALSSDIKLLGGLLGRIIQEQNGEAAYQLVEEVRAAAKDRRKGDQAAAAMLAQIIHEVDFPSRLILVKAFSNYFQLINIAEDQQRIRVLRQRESSGELSDSIHAAVKKLHQAGKSAEDVRNLLNELRVRLVLTAHPSEAKRKEVLIKLQHIANMMDEGERKNLLPREKTLLEDQLAEEIEELWQTKTTRARQTLPEDEVDFGLHFVTSVIMDVAIDIYDDLEAALNQCYPGEDWSQPPPVLRFASWIGGDRDGNPNVTTDVTEAALKTQRYTARRTYIEEVRFLRDHLTQSIDEVGASEELRQSVSAVEAAAGRFPGEMYRQQMDIILRRLEADAYKSSRALLADLEVVKNSLEHHSGMRVARGSVQRLLRKVQLFGLHLMPLEIREDARLHAQAVAELFRRYELHEDYLNAPESEKQALLSAQIRSRRPLFPAKLDELEEVTQRIITTWRMIAKAHEENDPIVIDTVIASMCQNPSDVLSMLLFAKEVGIAENVYIVPLFETIDDLASAPSIMNALFQNEQYLAHLQKRAGKRVLRQQIMIGYSDSSKDGGYIASNWNLYNAQQVLTEQCAAHGVSVELFHGRGGSIGRGGGPTNRAILSQPPLSLRGGIKITEQGEVIAYRYSNPHIARRHLHQVMNAVLIAMGTMEQDEVRPEWHAAMEQLSEDSRRAYRGFVYETEDFLQYWQQSTPINELSQLRISSRPAKRKSADGFASMRAIPWVFSWMQSRAIIPSWFGAGYAFDKLIRERADGLALLRQMVAEWPFFRALIENAELDVAKADMDIAQLYASLVSDQALGASLFQRIFDEHQLTERMICQITQQSSLLDHMPAIKTSIERRNPYVDPLNFIQVELLRELRSLEPESERYQQVLQAVLATINGIAAGMKTTG